MKKAVRQEATGEHFISLFIYIRAAYSNKMNGKFARYS